MLKLSLDAGHGRNTPGKRTPDDSLREWEFNNEVVKLIMSELKKYDGVTTKRFDDPTGETDIPLSTRTKNINQWNSDLHISIHANAFGSTWNDANGIETFVFKTTLKDAVGIAKVVQSELVKATGLKDRGVKAGDLHMVRETNMTAILVEHPFMTNKKEAELLKSKAFQKDCSLAIVKAIASRYILKKKVSDNKTTTSNQKTHTVVKGDTLWGLSQKYNVSISQLKSLNKLTSDIIHPKQKLRVK